MSVQLRDQGAKVRCTDRKLLVYDWLDAFNIEFKNSISTHCMRGTKMSRGPFMFKYVCGCVVKGKQYDC